MRHFSLEELVLTEDEIESAREQVKEIAYYKWQRAGCPRDEDLKFWNEAQLEWIAYYYVPNRTGKKMATRT